MQPIRVDDAPDLRRGTDFGELLGGLLLIAVAAAPTTAYAFVEPDNAAVGVRVVFAAWHVLMLVLMALLAPLVGWRRRDMWWSVLPFWGIVIAYRLGVGLVRRGRGDVVHERFPRRQQR